VQQCRLMSEGIKVTEVRRLFTVRCGQNCLQKRIVCECAEVFKGSRTSVTDADG
jgi:hypothetical protein